MTFKQALDKGAYVRKGEKGTPVIFAKKLTF
jgi:antirestriction protein ArdC